MCIERCSIQTAARAEVNPRDTDVWCDDVLPSDEVGVGADNTGEGSLRAITACDGPQSPR